MSWWNHLGMLRCWPTTIGTKGITHVNFDENFDHNICPTCSSPQIYSSWVYLCNPRKNVCCLRKEGKEPCGQAMATSMTNYPLALAPENEQLQTGEGYGV